MRNPTNASIKVLVALGAIGASGMASATSSSSQAAGVIRDNPGLTAGLLTVTGASTAATIGATVGSIAGGAATGGALSALPAGVTRFALPGQGGKGAAAAPGGKAWNAWFALSENSISYDYAPLASSGKVRVGLLGVDYTFSNNIVAGLAIAKDKTNVDLKGSTFGAAGAKLRGNGTTYSPYVGIPLNKNWSADASVGWGKTTVDVEDFTGTSSFDDKRQTATLGLSYRQMNAGSKWMWTARGAYLDIQDKIPGATINLRQVRVGGQAAYNAGIFSPYAGLNYIVDISAPEVNGAANDRDAFQAVLGIRFAAPNGVYGGLQYSSELNRSQIKNDQIMLNLGVRF